MRNELSRLHGKAQLFEGMRDVGGELREIRGRFHSAPCHARPPVFREKSHSTEAHFHWRAGMNDSERRADCVEISGIGLTDKFQR